MRRSWEFCPLLRSKTRICRIAGGAPAYLKQLRVIHKVQKKKSTKGHEGLRRATKGLEKAQEGSANGREGRKDFHQGCSKVSVKGAKDESAKGSQGVGKDSKGVREGPRRTLRFSTNTHSIIEPVSFLCSSFSSCLSCLSMFPNAANRFIGTWFLLPIGHELPLFHSRMDPHGRAGA